MLLMWHRSAKVTSNQSSSFVNEFKAHFLALIASHLFLFRHFLLEHQTVGDKRRKRRKLSSVSSARAVESARGGVGGGDSDAEDDADPKLDYDNRGLTKQVRQELLLLNPLLDAKGKRKSKTNVARGARSCYNPCC